MLQSCFLTYFLFFSPQVADSQSSAAELYRQAVQASGQGHSQVALQFLKSIVQDHPESNVAFTAVLHLAEQSIVGEQAIEAIDWLLLWSSKNESSISRIYDNSGNHPANTGDHQSKDDGSESDQRFRRLFATASSRLSDDQLAEVLSSGHGHDQGNHNPIEGEPTKISPTRAALLREQFRRAMRSSQPEQARQCLQEMGDWVTHEEREMREFHLPVKVLRQNSPLPNVQLIDECLRHSKSLSQSQRFTLKLAIAEAHQQSKDFSSAQRVLDQAADELAVLSLHCAQNNAPSINVSEPNSAGFTETELQQWRSIVDLKRAELLMLNGKTTDAKVILQAAIDRFPNSHIHHELVFLLSRCLIEDIEFEQALGELTKLIDEGRLTRSAHAQAQWFCGEIELLRRNADSAIAHYDLVLEMSDQPGWVARSLIQLGRCMELKSMPSEALRYYHQVVSQHADSDVAELAVRRITELGSTLR